jgi:hypothetical protein
VGFGSVLWCFLYRREGFVVSMARSASSIPSQLASIIQYICCGFCRLGVLLFSAVRTSLRCPPPQPYSSIRSSIIPCPFLSAGNYLVVSDTCQKDDEGDRSGKSRVRQRIVRRLGSNTMEGRAIFCVSQLHILSFSHKISLCFGRFTPT